MEGEAQSQLQLQSQSQSPNRPSSSNEPYEPVIDPPVSPHIDLLSNSNSESRPPKISSTFFTSLFYVLSYIAVGIAVYVKYGSCFKGTATNRVVDAVYFSVVTLCTVGYGDITPDSTFTKMFTCVFILVGFTLVSFLHGNGLVEHILDALEACFLNRCQIPLGCTVDEDRRRRTNFFLALIVVIVSIASGTVAVHFAEKLDWEDSVYLSISSVTAVGYGDYSFKTLFGRIFAIIWLLIGTLAVARAFLHLTDYCIQKRKRKMAKWILKNDILLQDFDSADLDRDGSISKSEYIIYKLKKMGKIDDMDILEVSDHFDSLDYATHHAILGMITRDDLMNNV